MKLKDWLELDREEQVGSFEIILDSIKELTEDEAHVLTVWFISTLSAEEMSVILTRENRDSSYIENLNVLNGYLIDEIIKCTQVAVGVKI